MSKPPQRAASPPAKPATAAAPSRAPAGYSGTPLVRKLGWRDGASVCLIGAQPHFLSLIVTGCLGLAASSAAQAQPAFTMASPPEHMARRAIGELPGSAVVGVWRGVAGAGAAHYAGVRDGAALPEAQLSGEQATLFEIGSISKVFTGLLLAQAVERGELNIDDTLGRLLHGRVAMGSDHVAAITLRQLVTHTSCLPRLPADFTAGSRRNDPYRGYDRPRLWAALSALKITQAPPCQASYSNLGVALLGEVLSERAGKPWHALVREHITEPLGMHDTLQALGDKAARLAPAFAGQQAAPPWEFDAFAGAGALRSSAPDMLRFGRAILAGRSGPLGAAAERLVEPLARFDGDIGYAVFLRGPAARRTWAHDGATGGYRAQLLIAPDTGEVVIAMASNAAAPWGQVTAQLLASRYPVEPGTARVDAAQLPDYAGVFRVNPNFALTCVVQDGQLYLRGTGQVFEPLRASGPDEFTLGSRGRVTFERDGARVVGLVYTARGSDSNGRRTDESVPARATWPEAQLKPLAGRYQQTGLDFDVQVTAGQITAKLNDQPRFMVQPVPGQTDRFAYDVVKAELQFERDANGEVQSLVLHQNGQQRVPKVK